MKPSWKDAAQVTHYSHISAAVGWPPLHRWTMLYILRPRLSGSIWRWGLTADFTCLLKCEGQILTDGFPPSDCQISKHHCWRKITCKQAHEGWLRINPTTHSNFQGCPNPALIQPGFLSYQPDLFTWDPTFNGECNFLSGRTENLAGLSVGTGFGHLRSLVTEQIANTFGQNPQTVQPLFLNSPPLYAAVIGGSWRCNRISRKITSGWETITRQLSFIVKWQQNNHSLLLPVTGDNVKAL